MLVLNYLYIKMIFKTSILKFVMNKMVSALTIVVFLPHHLIWEIQQLSSESHTWSTFFGIKTLARFEQKEKAPYDISAKLDGSITFSRLSQ